MKELSVGTRVAFVRDGVMEKGVVTHVYDELDTVLIQVSDIGIVYKVPLSDVEILSEPNDQDPKTEGEAILITPTEFENITCDLMELICDPSLKAVLTLFSETLYYKIFGTTPAK